MKAAYFYEPNKLMIEETDIPSIGKKEMLLKVKAASVCGTDLRIFKNGHFKIPQGTKRVLGHEFSGEIAKTGSDVKGYQEGERVVIVPNIGCGSCAACLKGYNQLCPVYDALGISLDGAFQEYMRIPEEAIKNRAALQKVMRQAGFTTIKKEWWHFDHKNAKNYSTLNIPI